MMGNVRTMLLGTCLSSILNSFISRLRPEGFLDELGHHSTPTSMAAKISELCSVCLLRRILTKVRLSAQCQQDRYDGWQCVEHSFPVFGYVEGPLEFEMSNIVVINELGNSFIMTASEDPRRSLFWGELLLVQWLIDGVGWIAAKHLLVLSDTDALAL